MHSFILGTALLAVINSAAGITLDFDCADMPNVCENMCWGIKCAGNNQKYSTLTWDKPSKRTKRARRTTANCLPDPNRCSTRGNFPAQGYNCDEFPFASVEEADDGGQFSRCVPSIENNIRPCTSQGAVLAKFFRTECSGTAPCTFNVAFSNYDSTSYCAITNDWQTKCKNTLRSFPAPPGGPAQVITQVNYQNGAPATNPTQAIVAEDEVDTDDAAMMSHNYRMADGRVVTAFSELPADEKIVRFVANGNCTVSNSTALFGRPSMLTTDFDESDVDDSYLFADSMLSTIEEKIVAKLPVNTGGSE